MIVIFNKGYELASASQAHSMLSNELKPNIYKRQVIRCE